MPPLLRAARPLDDESELHTLTLATLLTSLLGPEYLTWTPEALRAELVDLYGDVGTLTWERIQALRVLLGHDSFWKEWEVFEKVGNTICGEMAVFDFVQPLDAEELAIVLWTADQFAAHPYDEDVCAYMAACCLNDGFWYLEGRLAELVAPVLAAQDLEQEIQRDLAGVAAQLSSSGYTADPITAAQVQANRVIELRETLADYIKAVQAQLLKVPEYVKEAKK